MTNFDNEDNKSLNPEDNYENDDINENDEEYSVGYCKPPKHTQFKKGQSGNLKGRPKASENPTEAFAKELSKTIRIKENGEIKNVKVMDAIYKKIISLALQGNISILKRLLETPVISPVIFNEAISKYNTEPNNTSKTPSPELKLFVNHVKGWARELQRKRLEEE